MKKKWLAAVLAFACILCLVGCSKETAYHPTDVANVSIRISNVSPTGAAVTIQDTNDHPYVYGEWYKIEKESNGKWYEVKTVIDNYGFEDIGYLLAEDSKTRELNFDIDWKWLYGELPAGRYRLLKQVDQQYISVEFEIA